MGYSAYGRDMKIILPALSHAELFYDIKTDTYRVTLELTKEEVKELYEKLKDELVKDVA